MYAGLLLLVHPPIRNAQFQLTFERQPNSHVEISQNRVALSLVGPEQLLIASPDPRWPDALPLARLLERDHADLDHAVLEIDDIANDAIALVCSGAPIPVADSGSGTSENE